MTHRIAFFVLIFCNAREAHRLEEGRVFVVLTN